MAIDNKLSIQLTPLLEVEEEIIWTNEVKKLTLKSLFMPVVKSCWAWVQKHPKVLPISILILIFIINVSGTGGITQRIFLVLSIPILFVIVSFSFVFTLEKFAIYFNQPHQEPFKTPMDQLKFDPPKGIPPFYAATTLGIFQYNKELTYTFYENLHEFFFDEKRNQLVFREYKNEKYTDIPILGDYKGELIYETILPHWKENNPQSRLQELTDKIQSEYNLKKGNNKYKRTKLIGSNNLTCTWEDNYPFKTIEIKIDCPNPTNSYFSFSEEHYVSKKELKNEPQVGDSEIDDSFFLKTDNFELLEKLFTESLKNSMLNCYQIGVCNWAFGKPNPKNVKINLPKKRAVDLTEILDYQMAHSNYVSSYNEADWDENRISTLQLSINVAPEYRYSGTGIEQLLLNSMDSVKEMATTLDTYHSKLNS